MLTGQNERAGAHVTATPIWSEVRAVLARLQRGKCAYCERKLGSSGDEVTIDHFRPKGKIAAWKGRAADVGGASRTGYFLLAYDPRNYLAACRRCNNKWKGSRFPTARSRRLDTAEADLLAEELPYLVSPADPEDIDPERLIGWDGPMPIPADPAGRDRALVTIDVLGLAHEDLVKERQLVLRNVWLAHQNAQGEKPDVLAKAMLDDWCSPASAHSACARRFRELCDENPAAARRHVEVAMQSASV
ncbi:hypothetical protein Amsp01_105210 [Amycolatopsis sp. NBRC 101858]|nr:hypothetical protein Amsp01_105210 [Amycolatopsis sp. NBRC 101858]